MAEGNRVIMSADNITEVIPDVKRNQYVVNKDLKSRVLRAILYVHMQLAKSFTVQDRLFLNITVMSQISSHLLTVHTILRQISNVNGGGRVESNVGESITIHFADNERSVGINAAKSAVTKVFQAYVLQYILESQNKDHWYGMIAPLMTYIVAFNLRMNEVRVGCGQFTVVKKDSKTLNIRTSEYRLIGKHQILLDGITYPPDKRASMAQSMGPMTQLISLARAKAKMNIWQNGRRRQRGH